MNDKIEKTEAEWRAQLTDEQYQVCRLKGTERPFTGQLHAHQAEGLYCCVCCGAPLFDAATKYDSGSGWPSFWQPQSSSALATEPDHSLGVRRMEVQCRRCGAHLGHVFPDGPQPTGLRYCINSVALTLEPNALNLGEGL